MRKSLFLLGLFCLAACSAGFETPVSHQGAANASRTSPDKRGKIAIFEDTFGDATPAGIVAGPDGAMWFTDPGNDVVGRIAIDGTYTLQQVVGTELGAGITSGPGGNLWFTLALQEGGIGSITPSGVVTLYKDQGGSYTQSITTASDGTLWFGESNGTVGHRAKNGKITHFKAGPSDAALAGIVQGPDGNLWITEFARGSHLFDQVLRMNARGKVKAFTVGQGPEAICVGPDGALWFTEAGSNAIGLLTTAGKYVDHKIPGSNAETAGIAAGPDRAVWFTDATSGAQIGRVTMTGRIFRFGVNSISSDFANIALGPDGAMWFTSGQSPSAIGRVTTH
jgi:virginiamycin B lyase